MAAVKPEIKAEVKSEPSAATDSSLMDADEYEDDTDLVIPPQDKQSWLVKIPDYLWKTWSEMYKDAPDDQQIEIGKMRVYTDAKKPGVEIVQARLDSTLPQHADLPLNYDVNISARGYNNVVVFSEKDLPGHKNQPLGRRSHFPASRQSGISKHDRYGQQQQLPPIKPGSYRSAIPKQTALASPIQHIADANPVEDASYYKHFTKLYHESIAPKKTTIFQTGIDRRMQPGNANLQNFASFGITSRPGGAKGKNKKVAREKAVRISQEDLLDAIYHCFRRYKYWSLKALKNELKQPEQYIKQTLDGIATLVRSGDFAMTYMLNPEYAILANINPDDVKEETAAIKSEVESDTVTGTDMEDEEMGDFEDVKMEGAAGP